MESKCNCGCNRNCEIRNYGSDFICALIIAIIIIIVAVGVTKITGII